MSDLDPRTRRVLEMAYAIDGVSSAKVWIWPGRVAVGIRGVGAAHDELLRRIEAVTIPLRRADEEWEFGVLE